MSYNNHISCLSLIHPPSSYHLGPPHTHFIPGSEGRIVLTRGPYILTHCLTTVVGMVIETLHEVYTKPICCPQINLEHYKIKVSPLRVTGGPKSQIVIHFTLRPAIFVLQAISRQKRQITQANSEHHGSKVPHIYFTSTPPPQPQIPIRFSLRSRFFALHTILR